MINQKVNKKNDYKIGVTVFVTPILYNERVEVKNV